MYLTTWRFYSDLAAITRGGPHSTVTPLGGVPHVSPPTWECICARGDFFGANSYPQTSSHSLWERIYLPLAPCTWLPLGVTLLMSRPKGFSGVTWALHESDCSLLALLLWPGSHISLLFNAIPWSLGLWGFPTASPPPWSFLPMGIGEQHCGCLALVTFYLGNALPWRRLILAKLPLGDAPPQRCLMLTLTPTLTLTLTLSTPGYGTVHL